MKGLLPPHQEKFIGRKMKDEGYLSPDGVIQEALRVYELIEQEDNDPRLEAGLRHAFRSPLNKPKPGHFASVAIWLNQKRKNSKNDRPLAGSFSEF